MKFFLKSFTICFLVSLSSLNVSLYLLLVTVVGVVMMFIKKEQIRNYGEILAGLGILFVGLALMKDLAFPKDGELINGVKTLFEAVSNPFVLLLFGALFTALVQSSSATTGIVIVMVGANAISLASGFYLVLGGTIGTVITTILASIGGNTNVKRTAIICLVIRVITALIATIITIICEDPFSTFFGSCFGTLQFGLAVFLVLYNVIFMFALAPFLRPIIKLFEKLIKDKDAEAKKKAIHFIDDRLLNTPGVALEMVRKEVTNMLKESFVNYKLGYEEIVHQKFESSK